MVAVVARLPSGEAIIVDVATGETIEGLALRDRIATGIGSTSGRIRLVNPATHEVIRDDIELSGEVSVVFFES